MIWSILYIVIALILYVHCLKQDKKKGLKTDDLLKGFYIVFCLFWPFYVAFWLVAKLFTLVGGYFVKG